MERKLKFVSPEYQDQLEQLADRLVTERRFGQMALNDTVEFPAITDEDLLIEQTAREIGEEGRLDRQFLGNV